MESILYYQLRLTQRSPLRIGAPFGMETDSDVLRDRRGLPFLPGSGLAGLLRAEFDERTAKALFGYVAANGETRASLILVSDAVLPNGAAARISRRDGVGLNERKTAIRGAKYDFETAEADRPYTAVLELRDARFAPALEAVLDRWAALGLSVGARTTRGYGRMELAVRSRRFDFPADLDRWLGFDPFAPEAFEGCPVRVPAAVRNEAETVVRAALDFEGTFSVRRNTSDLVEEENTVSPDTVPTENRLREPVIPGTAWAGAFLHHLRALARDLAPEAEPEVDALFGAGGGEKRRSAIRFSETAVHGSARKLVTRTAIERFTAAPRSRALFSSEVAFPADTPERVKGLLGVALCDLNLGLLGFGGENGIGRGTAKITHLTVNGADRPAALRAGEVAALWKEATE